MAQVTRGSSLMIIYLSLVQQLKIAIILSYRMQSCIFKVDQRVNLKMKNTAVAQVRDKAITPGKIGRGGMQPTSQTPCPIYNQIL